ncbi:MAG TPA: MFS transporter [bacterium]|nr:MFS transporter [bacterium]
MKAETSARRAPCWELCSWGLYDLANTIFSMSIITFFLPQWLISDQGLPDLAFQIPFSLSMLLVGLTTPYLGALADERGDHLRPLRWLTILSVSATALMGVAVNLGLALWARVGLVMLLLIPANYGFQAAQVFYNSLLPSLAPRELQGKISGFGVALGYLGSIVAFLSIFPLTQSEVIPGFTGRTAAFIPTALLFGVLAIPCLLWVKDRSKPKPRPREGVWRRYVQVFKDTADYPGLRRYLLAAFLFLEAVHTVISMMMVYIQMVLGLPDEEKKPILVAGILAAIAGGLVWGLLTDRFGPRRVIILTLVGWIAAIGIGAFAANLTLFYGVGALTGFLMAGVWTAIRPMLLRLVPEEKAGEFFGLMALAGKAAAVVGPLIWGGITLLGRGIAPLNYRLALAAMGLLVTAGLVVFLGVERARKKG